MVIPILTRSVLLSLLHSMDSEKKQESTQKEDGQTKDSSDMQRYDEQFFRYAQIRCVRWVEEGHRGPGYQVSNTGFPCQKQHFLACYEVQKVFLV